MKIQNKIISIFAALFLLCTSTPALAYAKNDITSSTLNGKKLNSKMEINIPDFSSYFDDFDDNFLDMSNIDTSNCKYYKYTSTINNGNIKSNVETNMTTDEAVKYGINSNCRIYNFTTDDAVSLNLPEFKYKTHPYPFFKDDDFNMSCNFLVINIYVMK